MLKLLCAATLLISNGFCESDIEKTFTETYETGIWGVNEKGKGTSGSGSTIASTVQYRAFLEQFMQKLDVKSVVDFGCGDWAFSQIINWEGIDYCGIDVVKEVIENNQMQFASHHIKFIHAEGLSYDLPPADLLICKDVIQHLSNSDIFLFLNQLHKYKYCLITNDTNPITHTSDNPDIQRGPYQRWIDLTNEPFNVKGFKVFGYTEDVNYKQVLFIIPLG